MGVGKVIEYVCVSVILVWIVTVCTSPRQKTLSYVLDDVEKAKDLSKYPEFEILSDFRIRPDDPLHSYAVIRAWDRHLKLQGLLPIGTNDLSQVGPILQDPGGEYIVYGYDHLGHLTSWRQILSPSRVQKATRTTRK